MKNRAFTQALKERVKGKRRRKWYYTLSVTMAAVIVFCTVYALILPAITLTKAPDANGIITVEPGKTTEVSEFYLWLKQSDGTVVFSQPTWNNEEKAFVGDGIHDALSYTEDGTTYYLIPLSYFTAKYAGYDYDGDLTGNCPFTYAPNAENANANKTQASYVKLGDKYYLRVQDTTSLKPDEPRRSNIYYTPMEYEEVNSFKLWLYQDNQKVYDSNKAGSISVLQQVGTKNYLIPVETLTEILGDAYTFDAASCPFTYAPDATSPNANKTPARYVQVDGAWYVQIEDTGTYNPPRSNVYYTPPPEPPKTVTGVNHASTVFNLFDYWIDTQSTPDGTKDVNNDNWSNRGINADHALKFHNGKMGIPANDWTENANPCQGIVNSLLTGGYPQLSGRKPLFGSTDETLTTESLAYLFDPAQTSDYKAIHRNVGGLLQQDKDGYYYYDSQENFAEYQEDSNSFTLYDTWGVKAGGNSPNGQFFPFNDYTQVKDLTSTAAPINHYFGMTMTTRFVQRHEGFANAEKTVPTIFEFAGDDDVWVFIDDVLVADLGGIHDKSSVKIDFSTGGIIINDGTSLTQQTTLRARFDAAGVASEWCPHSDHTGYGLTFADNTYHTLKFFYLERGNTDSNLHLKYNLSSFPPTGINKVNQYGDAVSGAEFSVYQADKDYSVAEDAEPVYTGRTDENGEMLFVDEDGMPYTMKELKERFGEYFVLRETTVPPGYRLVSQDIRLHIRSNESGDVMLCDNTKASGVWADPTLQVTAPNTIYLRDPYRGAHEVTVVEEKGNVLTEHGKIFAVVLKYTGPRDENGDIVGDLADVMADQNHWAPVYGNDQNGFVTVDVSGFGANKPFAAAAIDTAKKYTESNNVFSLSNGGALEGGLSGMPGDITTYYYMLPADEKAKTEYTVAYYWTEADSLDGATAENTYPISTYATEGNSNYKFDRVFGATINVPNILNRLLVQKKDVGGHLVNGASFAMYKVQEDGGKTYYVADDGSLISLKPDAATPNTGTATQKDSNSLGSYKVDETTGRITVTIGSSTYTISPAENAEGSTLLQTTKPAAENAAGEDGTADFSHMRSGQYVIRELSAPAGFALNPAETMVLVSNDAVYANAGTADDGVTVARGPGYIVSSMQQFASIGDVDNTLSWIFTWLKVSQQSNSFDNATQPHDGWQYTNKQHAQDWAADTVSVDNGNALTAYLEYDPAHAESLFNYKPNPGYGCKGRDSISSNISPDRRLSTDVGWSYLEIYQDYPFGQEQTGTSQTRYEDWLHGANGAYNDISHLFSQSVYVQVTDKPAGCDLEIGKTVTNAPDGDPASFAFTVQLTGSDGTTPLNGSYPYTLYSVDAKGHRTEIPATDGKPRTIMHGDTIRLQDHQVAVIRGLPNDARYTVTEKHVDGYSTTAVQQDAGAEKETHHAFSDEDERKVSGVLRQTEKDDPSTVHFFNAWGLTIFKVDSLNPEVRLPSAVFTLTKDDSNTLKYYNGSEWVSDTATLTTDANGKIVLNGIGDGKYTLTEITPPPGYRPLTNSITLTVAGGRFQLASDNSYQTMDEGFAVRIPNNGGPELPATGGSGTTFYTLGGSLLMAAPLVYGYRKKRRWERRAR